MTWQWVVLILGLVAIAATLIGFVDWVNRDKVDDTNG